MSQSVYQHASASVNAIIDTLPDYLQDFLDYLLYKCRKKGYCWAKNARIASDLNRTESTVGRRIQRLEKIGLIRRDERTGRRRIYPAIPDETPPDGLPVPVECVPDADVLRTPLPYNESIPETKTKQEVNSEPPVVPVVVSSEEESPLVAELVAIGITLPAAVGLVRDFPAGVIRVQIAALPYRDYRDAAAVLIRSIQGNWGPSWKQKKADEKARKAPLRERKPDTHNHPRKPAEAPSVANPAAWDALTPDEQERVRSGVVDRIGKSLQPLPAVIRDGEIRAECWREAERIRAG